MFPSRVPQVPAAVPPSRARFPRRVRALGSGGPVRLSPARTGVGVSQRERARPAGAEAGDRVSVRDPLLAVSGAAKHTVQILDLLKQSRAPSASWPEPGSAPSLCRRCARQLRGGRDDRSRAMQSSHRRPWSAEPGGAISQDRASTRSSLRGRAGPSNRPLTALGCRRGGRSRKWRISGASRGAGRDPQACSRGY